MVVEPEKVKSFWVEVDMEWLLISILVLLEEYLSQLVLKKEELVLVEQGSILGGW